MNVLELFAGSRSIGKVAEEYEHKVYSSDIVDFDSIDYVIDILEFNITKVPFIPDMIWASPPCTSFSVSAIGRHWNHNNTPKSEAAVLGVKMVEKTLEIINHFIAINPDLIFYIENPRGKLRSLPVLSHLERVTVWYCRYGDTRAKPTDIWSNNIYNPMFNPNSWKPRPECWNNNNNCHHDKQPRGYAAKVATGAIGKGTQGLANNHERSKIPYELCKDIIINL